MGADSKIQWTTHTFSPWRGCAKVSAGCFKCYAERLSHRNPGTLGVWGIKGTRVVAADTAWRKVLGWDRAARKGGRQDRVFPSLCDPFEDRPELIDPRRRYAQLIRDTPNLDHLVLTKRPENAPRMLAEMGFDFTLPSNLWLGVSAEDQENADRRIPLLLKIDAAARFISYEPALGPVDFSPWLAGLSWVIVGGESGSDARPFDLQWARNTVAQCGAADVACFVKQFGANPQELGEGLDWPEGTRFREGVRPGSRVVLNDGHGGNWDEWPADLRVRQMPAVAGTVTR